jgi:hypothetical protein
MPDISMCSDDKCPARERCHRHKASGTKPSEPWQAYMDFKRPAEAARCHEFWPARKGYDVPLSGNCGGFDG